MKDVIQLIHECTWDIYEVVRFITELIRFMNEFIILLKAFIRLKNELMINLQSLRAFHQAELRAEGTPHRAIPALFWATPALVSTTGRGSEASLFDACCWLMVAGCLTVHELFLNEGCRNSSLISGDGLRGIPGGVSGASLGIPGASLVLSRAHESLRGIARGSLGLPGGSLEASLATLGLPALTSQLPEGFCVALGDLFHSCGAFEVIRPLQIYNGVCGL